jgi:hemerythrin
MDFPHDFRLAWHDGMLLGHRTMDVEHEELVRLINGVRQAADEGIATALDALASHLRDHFQSEEDGMTRTGFPAQACHAAEHAAVLQSVVGVRKRVEAGDFAAARRLADALSDWFPAHAEYLDAALSHWLCKQQHGGTPVVLRRHLPAMNAQPAPIYELTQEVHTC